VHELPALQTAAKRQQSICGHLLRVDGQFREQQAFLGPLHEGKRRVWRRPQQNDVFKSHSKLRAGEEGSSTNENQRLSRLDNDMTEYRKKLRENSYTRPRVDKPSVKISMETWQELGVEHEHVQLGVVCKRLGRSDQTSALTF
jgi:hypothetical protein